MKGLLLAAVMLANTPLLRADNLLQNGDFTASSAHWEGDGKTIADKGLVVILNPQSWTKIFQQFKGDKGTRYSINVTYRVSPDLTPSVKAEDYLDVNKNLGLKGYENFGQMNVPVGQFFGTIGDSSSNSVAFEVFAPKRGSSEIQTYQHTYPPISAFGNNIAALAFPPGSGSVLILNVSVTSS